MRDGNDVLINHLFIALFEAVCAGGILGGGEDGGESDLVFLGEESEGFFGNNFSNEDVDVERAVVCESSKRRSISCASFDVVI